MLEQELIDADKRAAALHEAAHAVLTEVCGGGARPFIWPVPGGSAEIKSWVGTCEIYAHPGSLRPPALMPGVVEPRSNALALVGLAGVAAELYDRLRDPDVVLSELQALIELDELSPTDKAQVGDNVPGEWLAQAIGYVVGCWPEIEKRAAHLQQFPEQQRPSHLP